MDSKKARICELEFLELCSRIFAYRNNPTDIATLLETVRPFIDFNPRIMSDLSKDIFNIKYKPSKEETAYVLHEKGYSLYDIGKVFNKNAPAICKWLKREIVLFPRCTAEQQSEVIRFMEQYNKIFTPDLRNII